MHGRFWIVLFLRFIFLFLCWVFAGAHAVSLWFQWAGAALQLQCTGFSLQWSLLLQSTGSRALRLSRRGVWSWLLHMWNLPQTRDWTQVPYAWVPIHCTTREVIWFLITLEFQEIWKPHFSFISLRVKEKAGLCQWCRAVILNVWQHQCLLGSCYLCTFSGPTHPVWVIKLGVW